MGAPHGALAGRRIRQVSPAVAEFQGGFDAIVAAPALHDSGAAELVSQANLSGLAGSYIAYNQGDLGIPAYELKTRDGRPADFRLHCSCMCTQHVVWP